MPGPVLYVAVAITAVAAGLVFKEVGVQPQYPSPSNHLAHIQSISSSLILISVQNYQPGWHPVSVAGPDPIYAAHHQPHPMVKMEISHLHNEVLRARAKSRGDQQNTAPRHKLSYVN